MSSPLYVVQPPAVQDSNAGCVFVPCLYASRRERERHQWPERRDGGAGGSPRWFPEIVAKQPRWSVRCKVSRMLADVQQPAADNRARPGFASDEQLSSRQFLVAFRGKIQPQERTHFAQTKKATIDVQEGSAIGAHRDA